MAITIMPIAAFAADLEDTSARTWHPQLLKAWDNHNLAVDFVPNGLWNYDGISWIGISER